MLISELADRSGVKTSTVRFYERRGLLPEPARSTGGYREYADSDVALVRFLQRGQGLGFTLAELDELTSVTRLANAVASTTGEPMVLSGFPGPGGVSRGP